MEYLRQYFPLQDINSVIRLFGDQLKSTEPNVAVLSLVCGFIEHHLTCKPSNDNLGPFHHDSFPVFEFDEFCRMYNQYLELIKLKLSHLDVRLKENSSDLRADCAIEDGGDKRCEGETEKDVDPASTWPTSREAVKAIADFIWSQLSTSYFKDRPHIQNVYSFLNGKRLDCFGVALLAIATAQQLGLNDVHLALSEDHAWVVFGEDGKETAEVTWHGKRDEIKRGSPIDQGSLVKFSKDWLYLGGYAVKCGRHMEAAAIVSAMNPGVNSKTDSELLSKLQQELLWHLFDNGHLDRYPMAICNLADLEEIEESRKSPSIDELYKKAIVIAETVYCGHHVYPYTYYGGYLHRQGQHSLAAEQWKNAALAAASFTHSREDEELYKDLNEVANTFFPEIVKYYRVTAPSNANRCPEIGFFHSASNLMNVIMFYDGVCSWEEGGSTTAIHSEWAKNFSKILSSFSPEIRATCKQILSEPTTMPESHDEKNSLSSKKMKSVLSLISETKIKSQEVNLHLTSQVGLAVNSSAKRFSEAEERTGRSKRFRL